MDNAVETVYNWGRNAKSAQEQGKFGLGGIRLRCNFVVNMTAIESGIIVVGPLNQTNILE